MAEYAKVIVDISQEKLDKTFEYRIPPYLTQRIAVGMQVYIPFGSRRITGYVVELSDEAEYDEDKLKNIAGIVTDSVPIESHLIALAGWMREHYGGTMNQALKMVLPIKEKKKAVEHKRVRLALHPVEAKNQLGAYERRHSTARARLLRALLEEEELGSCHTQAWGVGKCDPGDGGIRRRQSNSGNAVPQSGVPPDQQRIWAHFKR